jgi:hypothetical protein
LQYVDKPLEFVINKTTNQDKTVTESLDLKFTYCEYYFSKDEDTFQRKFITTDYTIDG